MQDNQFGKDIKNLDILSFNNGRSTTPPSDEDDECHKAFYNAIRSANIELLNTLINKWPGDYFTTHSENLDEALSKAYEELKLKNVPIADEMEIFVEDKLINLRFFSNNSEQDKSLANKFNIEARIELLLQSIDLLKAEYSNAEKVDEKFLFITKFVAQNINILKQQLKSTYDRLPWEEMEFCLVSFVSSHKKRQEINLFYQTALNKSKILNHLEHFANELKDIIEGVNFGESAGLPKLKRETVVEKIIGNCPQFEELYCDYKQIRDVHSLEKISDYTKLALSVNPKEKEGQLIIARVLQVIGEYLKNTLESPKLSATTSELLILSLPKNTRQVIIDLRNSLSHAYSLSKRMEIEENTDANYFIGVQNDIKKIGVVITDILYNNKTKAVRILLEKIANSGNLDEIKEVFDVLSNAKLSRDKIILPSFKIMEHEKLEKLIEELSNSVTEKTSYEKDKFNKISDIVNFAKTKLENIRTDYAMGFAILMALSESHVLNDSRIDHNVIRGIKFRANKTLENIAPQIETRNLKQIAELSYKISNSVNSRMQGDNLDKVNQLMCEIFYIAEFGTGDIKWIEKLRKKLNEKGSFIPTYKQKKSNNVTQEKYNKHLSQKLSELKNILKCNELSDKLIEKLPFYKCNKKLQTVVEMLILDIMSILGSSKNYLENNTLFLDENAPLLTGKCLRNHLAHDNAFVDIMLSNPSLAIILNAKKLVSENIMKSKKRIGKLVRNEPSKLKNKFDQGLYTITNQNNMFVALEQGNLEDLKSYLKTGADINARSNNSWTALHFAAKGPSLEIVKFVLLQNFDANVKDIDNQSPLHISAAHGRKNIVEFFVEEIGLNVDGQNSKGKTPLHIAACNGHKDIVEVLLKNKANTTTQDFSGLSPLYYAIRNDHVDVAKILLQKDVHIDFNEAMGGFTPLHETAERGNLELVDFLLQNRANINVRNDRDWMPLHAAAFNGHLEVVKILIMKGANVNASVIDGCTSLHYAVENGHEEVAKILIKHGANVNAADKTYYNTPLHYAAKDGYEGIVKILLENEAIVNVTTIKGKTPLHFAVLSGHLGIVVTLLTHGVNILDKDKNYTTLLHCAAENGHKEVIELLIKNRAEINAKATDNLTPLHVAALKGHENIIDLLIKNKAGVNNQDIKGSTPLHAAAMNGSKSVIDFLIKSKADINARTHDGLTPLHIAAISCQGDAVDILITNKAEVNAKDTYGITPLHAAVIEGHKDIVNLLIKYEAQVDAKAIADSTPLHLAVQTGRKELVKILAAKSNVQSNNIASLLLAIKHNEKEIVEVLIANGACVNAECGEPLALAVFAGYKDIVEILLKNKAQIDMKYFENASILHLAAITGHTEIVNALLKKGANVDALAINGTTALHIAAQEGHEEVVEILIANRANVNIVGAEGAPLHLAAGCGRDRVSQVLVSNGAKIKVKDQKNRIPLELAVANGHLQVVKMLIQYEKVDMNRKGNDDWTILHIASQAGRLEIVKYLVDEGSNIDAKNASGSKPIHIAAREGYKDIVEYFLSKGLSVNEIGAADQTLLHYAALKNQLEVTTFLIAEGADVNAKDANGSTSMHIAAQFGFKDIIELLLKNCAVYNAVDRFYRKPLEMAIDKNVINLLASSEKLFEAVKCNSYLEVEKYIKAGAFVSLKNADGSSPLHFAAWKGYDRVVNVLLQNKANPNVVGNKGITPLHYAAKFSHLKIVMALLSSGAIYNVISDSGKTPLDFAVDKSIVSLFNLLSESFKNIKYDNSKVINDLNKIKDIDIVKAIMRACDRENKTLIVAAVFNNFSKIEELKQISQGDISSQISLASLLLVQGNYQRALSIFKSAFHIRKEILGPDNPGTLDIQTYIAEVLYKQGAYHEALNTFEEIFQKQKEMLGLHAKDTLSTRSAIALVLHRQGNNEEAFDIYQVVYQKQKEMLGPNHSDTLNTQFHMALVMEKQGKCEEALNINRAVFKIRREILGANDPATVSAQNNIAMVLASQGKYEEALELYKEVFEKKKVVLGINHADTLRTLHNIAGILVNQKKYREALKAQQEVLDIQINVLGPNHPETLNTRYNMANVLFGQGKWIGAFKAYRECLDQTKVVFGASHPMVLDILNKIEIINLRFKYEGSSEMEILLHLQNDISIASSNGDLQTVQCLLNDGADVNGKDIDGRTPLHYAAGSGQIAIINILIENGADVTQVTNKGNTPLHTATFKGYTEIVELLLQHVSHDKLCNFINAKTTASGTTCLHVAANNGYLDIIKGLLKRGVIYNIQNNEGKTPFDYSQGLEVTNFLNLIKELFKDAEKGNVEIINKLRAAKPDEFVAITNARNDQGNTLLQIMIINKHKHITVQLLEMLKSRERVYNMSM